MNAKLSWAIFWALVVVFVVTAGVFRIPIFRELLRGFPFLIVSGAIFLLLGVALIFFTVKEKVGGILKKFLIFTGASSAGIPVSIFLHNAIYGLFILWFGPNIWDRIGLGEDEPVFFFIAVFLCPAAFLVGAVGSIILTIKRRRTVKKPPSIPQ